MNNNKSKFSNKSRNNRRIKNKRRGGHIPKGDENYSEYMKLYSNEGIRNTREAIDYAIEKSKESRKTRKSRQPRKTRQSRQPRKTRQRKSKLDNYNEMYLEQKEYLERKNLRSTRDIIDHLNKDTNKKSKRSVRVDKRNVVAMLPEVRPINKSKDYELTGNKFYLEETGGGGDCFFHSVAYSVFGDLSKSKANEIRSNMVRWVDENRNKLIDKNIISSGEAEGFPFCWLFKQQLSEMGSVSKKNKEFMRGIEPRQNSMFFSRSDQNRLIDIYCDTMGTYRVWADGKLEFYFMCNALYEYYDEKIRMILYVFPCPQNPENKGKEKKKRGDPCLKYIPSLGKNVREYCTLSTDDPITTIFSEEEIGLRDIYIFNLSGLHFQAMKKLT